MLDYAAAQFATPRGCEERYVIGDGAPLTRIVELPKSHVRRASSLSVRTYDTLRELLRLLARAVYLFPALIVVKLALWIAGVWWGDLITFVFVLLVVTTFAVFALTVLFYAIVGPPDARQTTLAFAAPREDAFERAARRAPSRMAGRVDAGLEPGAPVLVEQWTLGERLVRYVEGRSFAIVPESGPPCVVEITGSPVILAPYEEAESAAPETAGRLEGTGVSAPEPTARCIVRQGDLVEILADDVTQGAHLEDARLHALVEAVSPTGPYRAPDATALLVRCTNAAPIVIRVSR
ncbi:MAG TPA: hypothetical protein VIF62_38500 [Labilithrix sp.]|jgi:hypothetical protein